MGLDLCLLPFEADFPDLCFSHSVLSCDRDTDLYQDLLREIPVRFVPENFSSYLSTGTDGEACYGITLKTAYGTRLAYALASELVAVGGGNARTPEQETARYGPTSTPCRQKRKSRFSGIKNKVLLTGTTCPMGDSPPLSFTLRKPFFFPRVKLTLHERKETPCR